MKEAKLNPEASTIGFKTKSADLHRKSPRIFFLCLLISGLITFILLLFPLPEHQAYEKKFEPPPVVIHLRNIPKTRHFVKRPAPTKPFLTQGMPLEADEIMPDDIIIEDTSPDLESFPVAPPVTLVPDNGAAEEESEIFEYFAVEEQPVRINNVIPEYPPMAERANITGTVFLKMLVNRKGSVDSVIVEKGPDIFRESAIKAAKVTKFTPAKQNDRPVACWVIMSFRFVFKEE